MTPEQTEAYVDAAAAVLNLPLRAADRPGVLRFFALAAEFGAVIDAVPLEAHAESAVVFQPIGPYEEPL